MNPHEADPSQRPPTTEADGLAYTAFISYSHALDGKFAPSLQRALHQFAKPWYKRRAIRVFRDEASLAANPALWSSIEKALAQSEFFILLASPQAARSEWVSKEAAYWCDTKPPSNFLIALTEGEIAWDDAGEDFDWQATTALPPSLAGKFRLEPRYVDFRWTRQSEHLSLSHSQFKEGVADLAAPLHGRDKDELIGEDVRQHRRTRRLAAGAIVSLALLALAAVTGALLAVDRGNAARAQARLATSRALGAAAVNNIDGNYGLALLLAAKSYDVQDSPEARGALLSTLASNPEHASFLHTGGAAIATVAWSADGDTLVAGTLDGRLKVWNLDDEGEPRTLATRPSSGSTALAFSPDGGLLAAGSADGSLRIWDLGSGRVAQQPMARDDREAVRALAFSPSGDILGWGAEEVTGLWNVATGRLIARVETGVPVKQLFFSNDSRRMVSVDLSGEVTMLDVRTGQRLGDLPPVLIYGMPMVMSYSSDGSLLAVANSTWYVLVTNVANGETIGEGFQGPASIDSMAFSPDGSVLAVAGAGQVQIWDTASQTLRTTLTGYPDRILGLEFRPDGKALVAGSGPAAVISALDAPPRLGDVLAEAAEVPTVVDNVASVSFSRDGGTVSWLDTSDGAGAVEQVDWDLGDGREVARQPMEADELLDGLDGEQSPDVASQAKSPDGALLALGRNDGSVTVQDVRRRKELATLAVPGATTSGVLSIESLDFAADGTMLAAGYLGGVTVWDVEERRILASLPVGQSARVALSPDGATLATMTSDGVITLFDTGTRQRLGTLRQPVAQQAGVDLAFSPDGRHLGSTVSGGGMMLWDMSPSSWRERACQLVARDLTQAELSQFVGKSFHAPTCRQPQ